MKTTNTKSLIIITLLVIFSLSVTYAFLFLDTSNDDATGEGGCFEVDYTGQTISNASLVSTTSYENGASSIVTLSKNPGCDIYTEASIKIFTNTSTTAPISNGALKYKILQGSEEISAGTITTTGNTSLATVQLTEEDISYTVYIWIDSNVSNGTYNQTTYSGYLFAESIQTSTIK